MRKIKLCAIVLLKHCQDVARMRSHLAQARPTPCATRIHLHNFTFFFAHFFLYAAVPLSIHPWVVHHRYLPGCREPNVHTTCSTWPYYTDPFVANFISRRYGPHIYAIRSAQWRQRQKIQLNDKTFFSTQLYLRDFVE